jgi:hypothetical protein
MDEARAIVLELAMFIVLPGVLLSFLWQATDPISCQQSIDAGAGCVGQRLLHQVHEVIERQIFLPEAQDHSLFGLVKSILDPMRAAAFLSGTVSLFPAMDRGGRDRHLLCQSAAGFGTLCRRSRCFLLVVALEWTCIRVAFFLCRKALSGAILKSGLSDTSGLAPSGPSFNESTLESMSKVMSKEWLLICQ